MPERMSMLKCLTPFRHSHMNQIWSEEEKEDINREIVKTKASWLLERYSYSTFLPFSLLLSHILFSTDLLWIFPTPPKWKLLPTSVLSRNLWRWDSSALLLSSRTTQYSAQEVQQVLELHIPTFFKSLLPLSHQRMPHSINSLHWH